MDALPPIEIINAPSIEDCISNLPHRKKYFTLLLAWDASDISGDELVVKLQPLVIQGLVYLCTWGGNCELVHDAVDECVVEDEIHSGLSDFVLMTTWHDDEPLEEAFWFFRILAIPNEPELFKNFERFAVSINNQSWADEMKTLLAS